MKYVVRVADKDYEVEIEDIQARPVIARVDGEEFEVTPEDRTKPAIQKEASEITPVELPRAASSLDPRLCELTAPLPGMVIEVFARPGERIETGQVILVIEAMKMKNSIRSTCSGKVTEILVSAGETVAHKQALVRFEN